MLVLLLYVWYLAAFGIYMVLQASLLLMHVINPGPSIMTPGRAREKTLSGLAVLLPVTALVVTQKLTALEGRIVWYGAAEKGDPWARIHSFLQCRGRCCRDCALGGRVGYQVRIGAVRRTQLDWLHLAPFILLVLYLVLPFSIGATGNIDTREAVPLFICCIALVARLPARRVFAGAALALAATLVRVGAISVSWASFGEVQAQHLKFIRQLPVGARILVVQFHDVSRFDNDAHFIAWAVPERQAMVSSGRVIAPVSCAVSRLAGRGQGQGSASPRRAPRPSPLSP